MIRKKKSSDSRQRRIDNSGNARVFSYHANRSSANEPRGRYEVSPKAIKGLGGLRFVKYTPSLVALVAVVVSLIYASLLSASPRVSVVANASGQPLERPTHVYEEFISNELSHGIYNKSKLTFDSRPLVVALQQKFPEIANAVVTIPLIGHRPVVKIAVASPSFVLSSSSGAFYINQGGVPLAKVGEAKTELSGVTTVVDESGLPIELGKQVLPRETVVFIDEMLLQFKAMDVAVDSVILPTEANEVQVRPQGARYAVRFNSRGDAREQVGTFLAVRATLSKDNTVPKEYIDVRVEERAYYK